VNWNIGGIQEQNQKVKGSHLSPRTNMGPQKLNHEISNLFPLRVFELCSSFLEGVMRHMHWWGQGHRVSGDRDGDPTYSGLAAHLVTETGPKGLEGKARQEWEAKVG